MISIFLLLFLALMPLHADDKQNEVAKLSQAFGHLIGKNLAQSGVKLDVQQIIIGLQEEQNGKDSPMTEAEVIATLSSIQEKAFNELSATNLSSATAFMEKNGSQEGVIAIEKGKLHYKIEKPTDGALVEPGSCPLVRYKGTLLDGTVFGASKEEEPILLDEAIPGFAKGLVGMHEGEKRLLYIHPDMAYGASGMLPPNSLLTFEVEVVKANAPLTSESPTIHSDPAGNDQEIAGPLETKEVIR